MCLWYSVREKLLYNCRKKNLCYCVRVNEWMCRRVGWKYGDCNCWKFVTGVMQPTTAFCVWEFPTVSTVQRHCCSAAQWLWLSLYTNLFKVMFLFYCDKTVGQQHEFVRELRHTQTVYSFRVFGVENAIERTCRHIWENNITVGK